MKGIFIIAIIAITSSSFAQDTTQSVKKHRPQQELGIMVEAGSSDNSPHNFGLTGIQYKRFKTEHLGYRVFAAYSTFQYKDRVSYITMKPDSFIVHNEKVYGDMAMIGGGLEAQRHFYKNVYLFAALEIKASYGGGYIDTIIEKTYTKAQLYEDAVTSYRGRSGDLKIFFASFTPTIGAKLQHARFAAGIELLPVHFSLRNTNYYNNYSLTSADFDLLDFSTRLFIHYRF